MSTTRQTASASSTGQSGTAGDWLDLHYQVAEPEYLTLLQRAGLQPGWHVLDAGCGSGCFLPAIAEILGADGHLSALDLAPEHVEAIQARLDRQPLACPVEPRVGALTALPYADGSFDAVWCANVAQYLTVEELRVALAEFLRVLRPGGVLAIKDHDVTTLQLLPIEPMLWWRLIEVGVRQGSTQMRGVLRTVQLGTYLREAGFAEVARTTISIERSSPLRPVEAQFLAAVVADFAAAAAHYGVSDDDRAAWAAVSDPDSPSYLLGQPDIFLREGNVLAVGRKPGAS